MPRRSRPPTARLLPATQAALVEHAARLLLEGLSPDPEHALRRAAVALQLEPEASRIPDARRLVMQALASRQALFGTAPEDTLPALRREALDAMDYLAEFTPRLHGALLGPSAGPAFEACIDLHTDAPHTVAERLAQAHVPAQCSHRHVRLVDGREWIADTYVFSAGRLAVMLRVLPEHALRHPPRATTHEGALKRISAAQLRGLIDAGQGFT